MADDEQSTSGTFAGMIEEYFAQLRGVTERLQNLAGSGPQLQPAPGGLPLPGALSAAQLASIANSIAAQRRSIEALKAQLSSFDEQLAALEQILGPLAQWGSKWAEFEQRLLNLPRPPESAGPARSLPGNSAGRSDPPWTCRRRQLAAHHPLNAHSKSARVRPGRNNDCFEEPACPPGDFTSRHDSAPVLSPLAAEVCRSGQSGAGGSPRLGVRVQAWSFLFHSW
jgi:hypothetical protein